MYPHYFWGKITDNADPDGLSRVRASKVGEEGNVTDWIPVLTPYAGNDTGLSLLPDVDEQVLVVSLDVWDVKKAVIGGIWSNEAKPPETGENSDADLNQDGNNSLKFIKSRAGSQLIFDDTGGAEKTQLISPDGKSRLEMNMADELFSITTENDLAIGAKGSITIQAEEINVVDEKQFDLSTGEYQISGKDALNIETDKDMGIKGSGIALN
jgi:phage baseplate assembly protein gpV